MEDETGSGPLELQKFTPEMHVQQLMIDLHDAHEENKQLREDLARAIEKANRSYSNFGAALLLSIVISNAIWIAFSFASK